MSKDSAKKLMEELAANEQLRAKIEGITDPAELLKAAVDAGYDVTGEELIEAEKELRKGQANRTARALTMDELESVAGGEYWDGEDAPDGHEMGCHKCYHDYHWQKVKKIWCKKQYFCDGNYLYGHEPACWKNYET